MDRKLAWSIGIWHLVDRNFGFVDRKKQFGGQENRLCGQEIRLYRLKEAKAAGDLSYLLIRDKDPKNALIITITDAVQCASYLAQAAGSSSWQSYSGVTCTETGYSRGGQTLPLPSATYPGPACR